MKKEAIERREELREEKRNVAREIYVFPLFIGMLAEMLPVAIGKIVSVIISIIGAVLATIGGIENVFFSNRFLCWL
ncbi:hypothetical protein J7K24_02415 [bacterium]|nr:hypothetical protein [bacterium]